MRNAIAELGMPALSRAGVSIVCPVCGQDDDLTLIVDSDDFSESASFMRCDDAHVWSEPRFPRRMGAELLALIERDRPESIDRSAVA